ncbi:caspase family protein [Sulfurimonas sp.]|nr:caspase family protein [Sulfurimonas sp.]
MKHNTIVIGLIAWIVLIFNGCSGGAGSAAFGGGSTAFKQYEAPKNTGTKIVYKDKIVEKEKIIYKDKIVYKGGDVSSAKQSRMAYKNSSQDFNFQNNPKKNYTSYALIIGISNYKSNSDVAYADKSALAFEELAKTTLGIPPENITTLLNSDATSGQLKDKLNYIKNIPEEGDTIYLFYAGHGLPDKDGNVYLLPSDMSADSINEEPKLQVNYIYKNLSKSLASNIFVFMDSCFSGQDDNKKGLYKGVAAATMVNKMKVRGKKLTVMTAGASNQFANDYKDKEHRLFSYYLINELAKGEKNLSKVYKIIRRSIKRISLNKGNGYMQVPQIYGDSSKNLY